MAPAQEHHGPKRSGHDKDVKLLKQEKSETAKIAIVERKLHLKSGQNIPPDT